MWFLLHTALSRRIQVSFGLENSSLWEGQGSPALLPERITSCFFPPIKHFQNSVSFSHTCSFLFPHFICSTDDVPIFWLYFSDWTKAAKWIDAMPGNKENHAWGDSKQPVHKHFWVATSFTYPSGQGWPGTWLMVAGQFPFWVLKHSYFSLSLPLPGGFLSQKGRVWVLPPFLISHAQIPQKAMFSGVTRT